VTKPAAIRQEDLVRAIKAARKAGLARLTVTIDGATIDLPLDDAHLGRMSDGHLPHPVTERKLPEPRWK
jgi:hypothetical protein